MHDNDKKRQAAAAFGKRRAEVEYACGSDTQD
jgi:hypothetical protein